ncbi:DUF4190 domain-containing protein [Microbacterium sp. BH-3-3-3]|uniref:DUF4190 domain-containing protein n=1 Tax=Microbacterium sp. BH-3-3-3 TaxID=1906742 RepID=UPI00089298D2|nr:DUF4190 domain-containing protein [Microbacterium sp. BH-3-3-3]AOX45756.1 hypothetical protein BJP65_07995 [Microbacterium sp. BH-3-3-3]
MSSALIHLSVPVDAARDAVAAALGEQGFRVQPTASGSLDVSRGSLGTTLVAGAFAGQDMHVRFDVHFAPEQGGATAAFEHSAAGGFFKGGAIGAAKSGDVVSEAAHAVGVRLAQQGLVVGAVPAPSDVAGDPAAADPASADPALATASGYPGYPGAAAPSAGYTAGGYPAGAIPPPVDYANRTNVVSIVAIVLGFVVPLGGIIAGAVGLAQIKRTGEKGRGLAITGIIAGSVLTVLTILGVIALIVFAVFAESQSSADPFVPPSTSEDGGVTIAPGEPTPDDVYVLAVGECLDALPSGYVSDDSFVDCATPHSYEVFAASSLADGPFPGDDAITAQAEAVCDAEFASFIGLSFADSTLNVDYFAPVGETWAEGDRAVSCLVSDPAGEVSGSLAGSAR